MYRELACLLRIFVAKAVALCRSVRSFIGGCDSAGPLKYATKSNIPLTTNSMSL